MKSQAPAKTPQKADEYLSWTRPVLKKGGIASETLNGGDVGHDGFKSHARDNPNKS